MTILKYIAYALAFVAAAVIGCIIGLMFVA